MNMKKKSTEEKNLYNFFKMMLDYKVFFLETSEMYLGIFLDFYNEKCKNDSETPISTS